MKKYKFILLFVVLFALTMISFAQMTEEGQNECNEGGLLEGQCSNTDVNGDGIVDQTDIDWMYTCGYYLSQVDDELAIGNDEIPLDGCELPEREIKRPDKGSPYVPKKRCAVGFPALNGPLSAPIGCPI